jgi:XTP/dITP diphosphohydrolase
VAQAVEIVFASHNAHKHDEVRRILATVLTSFTLLAPEGPAPVEDGDTFVANALIKARAAHIPGGVTVADDSGIVVDALGGAPGIHSARYSQSGDDVDNVDLLLANLEGIDNRTARFVCAAAVLIGEEEHVIECSWPGRVAREPSGDNGFGYDPIFIPDGVDSPAATLSAEQKDALSHRGQAFREVARLLDRHASGNNPGVV